MADLAYTFHFQPSELMAMPVSELMLWHSQIGRIAAVMRKG